MKFAWVLLIAGLAVQGAYAGESELAGMQVNLPDGFTFNKEGKIQTDIDDWHITTNEKEQFFKSPPEAKKKAAVRITKPGQGRRNIVALQSDKGPFYVAVNGDRVESATRCSLFHGICVTHTADSCAKLKDSLHAKTNEEFKNKVAECAIAGMNLAFNKQDALHKLAYESIKDLNERTEVHAKDAVEKLKPFTDDFKNSANTIAALNMSYDLCSNMGTKPAPKGGLNLQPAPLQGNH